MSENACKVVLALISLVGVAIATYKEIRLAEISANNKDYLPESK